MRSSLASRKIKNQTRIVNKKRKGKTKRIRKVETVERKIGGKNQKRKVRGIKA